MKCPNCGTENARDARRCVRCGTALGQPTPAPARGPAAAPAAQGSVIASLGRLGIPVRAGQLIGIAAGVIMGLIVARALPYIYPIFTANLLDVVFGPGITEARDGFNSHLMTGCTCCSSFLVALVGAVVLRPWGKRKP
jgi:hypothetical protein